MARIIEAEGRRIEVPDDATPEEINQIFGAPQQPQQSAPMSPQDMGLMVRGLPPADKVDPVTRQGLDELSDYFQQQFPQPETTVGGMARSVLGGFNRGVAVGSSSLLDAVNYSPMLLNLLPGEQGMGPMWDPNIAGSNVARRRVRDWGLDMSNPDTPAERIVGSGAEFVGSMVPYLAQPYLAAAERGFGPAIPAAQSLGQRAGRGVLEGVTGIPTEASIAAVQNAPGRALVDQLITGAAAGLTGGAMREAVDTPVSELMGNLIGGFAGSLPVGLGRRWTELFGNLVGANSTIDNQARRDAGQVLAGNMTTSPDDVLNAIEQNTPRMQQVPGMRPTLGQVSGDEGIKALEYARGTGGTSPGLFATRRTDQQRAIQDLLRANAPEEGAAERLIEQMGMEQASRLQGAEQGAYRAQREAQAAAPRASMTASGRGAAIRPEVEAAWQQARGDERAAWQPIDEANFAVPAAPLAQRFEAAIAAIPEAERRGLPPEISLPERWNRVDEAGEGAGFDASGMTPEEADMARALTGGGAAAEPQDASVNISEIVGLRSRLSDEARAAAAAGRPDQQRRIIGFIDQLDNAVAEVVPDDYREALEAARAASLNFNDRYTRTVLGDIHARDQSGAYRMAQSDIPSTVIQPNEGNLEPLQQLLPEVGRRPAVVRALEDQIMALASEARTPDQMRQFIQDYGAVLQSFPQASGALQRALQAGQTSQAADETLRAATAAAGPQSRVGRFIEAGQRDPVQAMRNVMAQRNAAPAQIDEILRFAGDTPEALEGLRRAAWDGIMQKATSKMTDPDAPMILKTANFRDLLNQNRPALERLYRGDREALGNLEKLADVAEMVQRVNRARPPGSSGTPLGQNAFKLSMPQVWSRVYALKRGQVGPHYVVTELLSRAAQKMSAGRVAEASNRILDDALLDPELAKVLLTKYNPEAFAAGLQRLRTYRKGYYANVLDALNGDEGDPDAPPEDEFNQILGIGRELLRRSGE